MIAIADYKQKTNNELTLEVGDVINNVKKVIKDWWQGELRGRTGIFPSSCVKVNQGTG